MSEIYRRTFMTIIPAVCCGAARHGGASSDADPEPDSPALPPNVRPPAQEPLPGVYASLAGETVYVIRCGERSVLLDTGYVHNVDAHLDNFESAGVDLESIDAIIVSHFHVDHAAGLARARGRLKCPVVAHKNNVPTIETGDRVVSAAQMPYLGWDFPFPPCPVDEVIEDGDTITIGDTTFDVIHIPGHTPGCVGYLWAGNLITGDVIFPDGSLGWADVHWGSNYLDTIETLDRITKLAPKYLLPTHGLPFPFDPSITAKGRATSEHHLKDKHGGILAHTHRAPLRDPGEEGRVVKI